MDNWSFKAVPPTPETPESVETSAPESPWLRPQMFLLYFLAALMGLWLLSGFYKIGSNEVALVERMGAFLRDPQGHALQESTGLNYHLPWPIDTLHKVAIQQTRTLKVADFNSSPEANAELRKEWLRRNTPPEIINALLDPYLITGDKNVLHIQVTIQYHVVDPEAFLIRVYQAQLHRDDMIRQLVNHALIRQSAQTSVDKALFDGRQDLESRLLAQTLREVEKMGLGIQVDKVQLESVKWPALVDSQFSAVIQAQQNLATTVDKARAEANRVETEANGEAKAILSQAESYRERVVREAQGETNRFAQVWERYQAASDSTRFALRADALNAAAANVKRLLLVEPGQKSHLVLPPVDEK